MVNGQNKLKKFLKSSDVFFLDTVIFIYLFEHNDKYATFLKEFFSLLELGNKKILFSSLLLTELLAAPFKTGDQNIAKAWLAYFKTAPNIEIIDLNPSIAVDAAFLRSKYNIKTPDSVHLATAMQKSGAVFLTNDKDLKKVKEVKVIIIGDFL